MTNSSFFSVAFPPLGSGVCLKDLFCLYLTRLILFLFSPEFFRGRFALWLVGYLVLLGLVHVFAVLWAALSFSRCHMIVFSNGLKNLCHTDSPRRRFR